MFADYISLGYNCESGYAVQRYGQTQTNYFDWSSSSTEAVTRVIENRFEGVQLPENLSPDGAMMLDAAYGYRFYGPWTPEKLERRVKRFLTPRGRRLYVLKTPNETPYTIARLLDALGSISEDFELVNVRPQECADRPIRMSHDRYTFHERYLKRYAPDSEIGDLHVISWDRIFQEFPLSPPEAAAKLTLVA